MQSLQYLIHQVEQENQHFRLLLWKEGAFCVSGVWFVWADGILQKWRCWSLQGVSAQMNRGSEEAKEERGFGPEPAGPKGVWRSVAGSADWGLERVQAGLSDPLGRKHKTFSTVYFSRVVLSYFIMEVYLKLWCCSCIWFTNNSHLCLAQLSKFRAKRGLILVLHLFNANIFHKVIKIKSFAIQLQWLIYKVWGFI